LERLGLIEEATMPPLSITKSNYLLLNNSFRLFIYGGHDIREGSKDTLYMLDLRKLKDLDLDAS
jgi:hypothetical protein